MRKPISCTSAQGNQRRGLPFRAARATIFAPTASSRCRARRASTSGIIGPRRAMTAAGRGNILSAWDPITQTERWRAEGGAAGFNSGGTLATGGNVVFSSVNTRLLAFKADTGEKVLDVTTGVVQMGPLMTFLLDGKQYVAFAGGWRRRRWCERRADRRDCWCTRSTERRHCRRNRLLRK